jgi:nucleosome binding factor SPN SPT16 subunit
MPERGTEGIVDKVKDAAEKVTDKVKDLFNEHGDKIDSAVDSAGDFVDDKTGGKYSERIDKVRNAAHDAVGKLSGEGGKGSAT